MSAVIEIALSYIDRGWCPVPYPVRKKGPTIEGWQNIIISDTNIHDHFNGLDQNIGLMMGEASHGLTDVDLDAREAVAVAPYLLPETHAVFGRTSKRFSHMLYYTNLAARLERAAEQFTDPVQLEEAKNGKTDIKAMLVELRTGGGGKVAQTMAPGSTHPSGELVAWEKGYGDEPATVDGDELLRSVKEVAAAALVARYWPPVGVRHDTALTLGGFLARCGMPEGRVKLFAEAVAVAAGGDRRDTVRSAIAGAQAFATGRKAYGLTHLREMLEEKAANKCAEWLGYRSERTGDAPPDQAPQPQQPTTPLIQSSAEFTENYVPPDYLIEGFLRLRFVYSLTARTGTGKTAIALLLGAHVALGLPFGSREVELGRVLIFAGENPDDIRDRWIAMSQRVPFDPNIIPVYFIPGRFKISQLIDRIRQEVQQLGGISLLIIDTSAAYFEGDDENSNVQLGAHAARIRALDLPGGPCTIVNCHPVKNATDDNLVPRGGGAFVAEVDGNLTARKDDMTVELHWQAKFRGPDFPPMHFLLTEVTHERLVDSKGRLTRTVVATHLSDTAKDDLTKLASHDEDELLKALRDNKGISVADLAKTLGWLTAKKEPQKSKVHRVLARLKKEGLVKHQRRKWVLTPKARKLDEQ